jgi:hypothetical protein
MNDDEMLALGASARRSLAADSDRSALWAALDRDDPSRACAAWALAGLVSSLDRARDEWNAELARGPRALIVACFLAPNLAREWREVAQCLDDPNRRELAARALLLHVRRGGALGESRARVVLGQRHEDAQDLLAFAIARAEENGEDFSDCADELVACFRIRWESARAIGALLDRGADFSAHASRVLEALWLGTDARGVVARRIIASAVARGAPIALDALDAQLATKTVEPLSRALASTRALIELGADVRTLFPRIEKLLRDKRKRVQKDAADCARALAARPQGPVDAKAFPTLAREAKAMPSAAPSAWALAVEGRDAAAMAALLDGPDARTFAGALHAIAGRNIDAALLAAATVRAVAHQDDVVRFAVIDAIARGCATPCDLRPHVTALIDALSAKGRPALAPGSATWQTGGLADSAAAALALAARWDETDATRDALSRALDARAHQPAALAARALAEGALLSGRGSELSRWLTHPSPHVRKALLHAFAATDTAAPRMLAAAIERLRSDPDGDVSSAALRVAMEGSTEDEARARAARIRDGVLRLREVGRIRTSEVDPAMRAALTQALAESLTGPDAHWCAVALAKLAEGGAHVAPHAQAICDALGRHTFPTVRELARSLRVARAQGATQSVASASTRHALLSVGAVDLVAPDPNEPWDEPRIAAVRAKLVMRLEERHPSFFSEACEAAEMAATLLGSRGA